jgi:hypothetical protein
MRKRLPDVNRILSDVKSAVSGSQMEKSAAAIPQFTVSVAQDLYKLATMLKSARPKKVTYEDVNALGERLLNS